MDVEPETIEQLRQSFAYGSRSNLNFKFLKGLSDDDFGAFLGELLSAVAGATDDGDVNRVIDAAYRWQLESYSAHLGDPADFPHRHDDIPLATLDKPLSECTIGLLTSSGHFVDGDDPRPFDVDEMTQTDAEARIAEFLSAAPSLSAIPVDTPASSLKVRHGGYPVASVAADHQVALPLEHMKSLVDEKVIGELAPTAYSFVGATSQVRLRKQNAPEWAEQLRDDGVDAVLLVPV